MSSNFFNFISSAVRSLNQTPEEIERIGQGFADRQPIYWPENFDKDGRHILGVNRDWDTCEGCGTYAEVRYWYGGARYADGEVIDLPQIPLCQRCQREVCG